MNEDAKKIDAMVEDYLQLRDKKEALKREYAEACEPVDAAIRNIENALQSVLRETGMTNLGTKKGTVYETARTFTKVADWNILLDYVKKNDAFDLLTKNVSKDAVVARINDTGEYVPGIDITTVNQIGVRRK